MARFASEAELETFLVKLDSDYGQYASAVWQDGVRTANQLANADKEDPRSRWGHFSNTCQRHTSESRASRLACGNSQLYLWLHIPLPSLPIPNLARPAIVQSTIPLNSAAPELTFAAIGAALPEHLKVVLTVLRCGSLRASA